MPKRVLLWVLVMMLLAACGGGDDSAGENSGDNAGSQVDEEQQPTPFPTFAFTQPTLAPQVATAAALGATATFEAANSDEIVLDPVAVERGLGRYQALECASCHGENGEGVEDGSSLLEWSQSQDEFIDFMRTGGEMGDDHRFPAERLSNSGIENLYQYLVSLVQESE